MIKLFVLLCISVATWAIPCNTPGRPACSNIPAASGNTFKRRDIVERSPTCALPAVSGQSFTINGGLPSGVSCPECWNYDGGDPASPAFNFTCNWDDTNCKVITFKISGSTVYLTWDCFKPNSGVGSATGGRGCNTLNGSGFCAMAYCYLGDAKVQMADGTTKAARDVEAGDLVIGADGIIEEVNHVVESALGDRRVVAVNGQAPLFTEDHPIISADDQNTILVGDLNRTLKLRTKKVLSQTWGALEAGKNVWNWNAESKTFVKTPLRSVSLIEMAPSTPLYSITLRSTASRNATNLRHVVGGMMTLSSLSNGPLPESWSTLVASTRIASFMHGSGYLPSDTFDLSNKFKRICRAHIPQVDATEEFRAEWIAESQNGLADVFSPFKVAFGVINQEIHEHIKTNECFKNLQSRNLYEGIKLLDNVIQLTLSA